MQGNDALSKFVERCRKEHADRAMPRRVLKLICGDGACGGGTGERERCFVEKCRIMSKRIYGDGTNSAQIIFVEICRKMSTRSNGDGAERGQICRAILQKRKLNDTFYANKRRFMQTRRNFAKRAKGNIALSNFVEKCREEQRGRGKVAFKFLCQGTMTA